MIKLILNNLKLLLHKKSFIIMGIVAPAIIIMIFSFAFGNDSSYKVGVIDKDNNYISKEIIKTIKDIDNIQVIDINKEEYELLLITHQIELAVVIEEGFSENILAQNKDKIIIKSINNNDVVSTITSIIKSKADDLGVIAKISNNNIDKFRQLCEDYNEKGLNYTLNEILPQRPSIENSIGIVIMIIFITGSTIANFMIEEEENNTKSRILGSGINISKYYISMIMVFYILSCMTSIIYYVLCRLFDLDFGMDNTMNFLVVLLLINLVSVSLNLCIVSFTRSRYVANTMNILIVVPTCMISGVFWDFDVMPKYLKSIGRFMPQRWVYNCLESLQKYNSLEQINIYLLAMILLSVLLFIISLGSYIFRENIS